MNNRIFATGLAAVVGIGALTVPTEAPARAGGFMTGRAGFIHGGPIAVFQSFRTQPMMRPVSAAAASQAPAVRVSRAAIASHPRFHRFFGNGLPSAGIGVYYGAYDAQVGEVGTYEQPAYGPVVDHVSPVPPTADRVSIDRADCHLQSRIVPSEDAGRRPVRITITRC